MLDKVKLISIVSPAHNEERNIPLMVSEVKKVLSGLKDKYDFEYILVDDGSKDATWQAIIEESKRDERIKGISFTRNFGHQIALIAGLEHATGDLVIYCDADLQQPPELFLKMISAWENGYKVVHTRRMRTEGIGFFKNQLSNIFYRLINSLSDTRIEYGMADFKLLDRSALDKVLSMKEHNKFLRGLVPWMGFKSSVVDYVAKQRIHGNTGYSFRKNLEFAKSGILSFSLRPLRYIGYLGILLTLSAAVTMIFGLFMSLYSGSLYFSPTFILLLFNTLFIGLVLSSLGIIALYLSYVYVEVVDRPLYIVEDKTF